MYIDLFSVQAIQTVHQSLKILTKLRIQLMALVTTIPLTLSFPKEDCPQWRDSEVVWMNHGAPCYGHNLSTSLPPHPLQRELSAIWLGGVASSGQWESRGPGPSIQAVVIYSSLLAGPQFSHLPNGDIDINHLGTAVRM